MDNREQRRVEILTRLMDGTLSMEQASCLLGVTDRQVRRMLGKFRTDGMASVVHGNAGRVPVNKTPAPVRLALSELAGRDGVYRDFNTCHMQELLAERDGIQIGRSTLDRLLCREGIRKRRRGRPRRTFKHRERMAREGEMLMIDGSTHDWLEGRDPRYRKICLHGCIDDATGTVRHLRFWPTECQAGYIQLVQDVTVSFGIPMSFYHDRHTILCSPKETTIDDELAGRKPMSQFEAILAQLGAEPIRAMTPQAKGRIERMWQTMQDRLVKEMRLAGVRTLEEANAFLPRFIARYNARFGAEARDPQPAWVEAPGLDLPFFFATKEQRVVRADHTLSWKGMTLLIRRRRGERSLAQTRVQVHTTTDGEVFLYSDQNRLFYQQITDHTPTQPVAPVDITAHRVPPEPQHPCARRKQMAYLHTGVAR